MSYIYCDACGIGLHSNVFSCPECGRRVTRVYGADAQGRRWKRGRTRPGPLRDDVERQVWESIYGWHSGSVECRRGAISRQAPNGPGLPA